jgi:tRNA (guanine37-N1)-methyltransferase
MVVPEVLTSGHHGKIAAWKQAQALERTRANRPDLSHLRTGGKEI